MDEELLNELLNVAEQHARMVLLELKMRSLEPSWVLISRNGEVAIVGTPWADDDQKEGYARMIRAQMRKEDIVAYSFITEAWRALLEPDEWDEKTGRPHRGMSAGRHPRRQEIVIACACTASTARWRQWRMVREATTEVLLDLKEQPFPESENYPESWLSEMLKK